MNYKKKDDPWLNQYQEIIKELDITNHKNKLNTYRIIGINYNLQRKNKLAKFFLKSAGWVISTGIMGTSDDYTASKLEKVTKLLSKKYTKKYNQDYNSIISNIDHIPILIAGYEAINNANIYNQINDNFLSTTGFYATLAFSGANVIYNLYRISNRDDKARPAYGFTGLFIQALTYKDHIINENILQSKKNGTSIWYTAMQTAVSDFKNNFKDTSKFLSIYSNKYKK